MEAASPQPGTRDHRRKHLPEAEVLVLPGRVPLPAKGGDRCYAYQGETSSTASWEAAASATSLIPLIRPRPVAYEATAQVAVDPKGQEGFLSQSFTSFLPRM
jgi:hypothetical protein